MKSYNLNQFNNIEEPTVNTTINIINWLELIKSPSQELKKTIDVARSNGKGTKVYESIKKSLPCVTYNFLFDKYKNNNNISSSTGLLYLDIDEPELNIKSLNPSKIFSYYKSFGGNGYAIIVRVDGLTKSNFNSTYDYILSDLGLTHLIDKKAKKPTQFSVISYDYDLYFNSNSLIYYSIESNNKNAPTPIVYQKKERAYTNTLGAKSNEPRLIILNKLDEVKIPLGQEYVVNWDGIDWINCSIPFNKINKNRNDFLLSYCTNLVHLNPFLSEERVLQIMVNVNQISCETPVNYSQIKRVVNSVFTYKIAGTLKPHYNYKKRKIVFKQDSKLNKFDKLYYCGQEIKEYWRGISIQKINDILMNWDWDKHGKISQRKIYRNYPIAKNTVEKYWGEFKEVVTGYNQAVKDGLFNSSITAQQFPSYKEKKEKKSSRPFNLSEALDDFINRDRAYFIGELSRSKTLYDEVIKLGEAGDVYSLIRYMDGFWFMDDVKNKFKDFYNERIRLQVA